MRVTNSLYDFASDSLTRDNGVDSFDLFSGAGDTLGCFTAAIGIGSLFCFFLDRTSVLSSSTVFPRL